MGRQKKQGLSWFPLVVNFFSDKRIRRLISRFGAQGALLYIYILCAAYENGYYLSYTPDFLDDAALDLGCDSQSIKQMLDYLLDKGLLSREKFESDQVLSSHGIQMQFQESMKLLRRQILPDKKLWLLSDEETLPLFKAECETSRKKQDKSGENDTKERKGNKTKENERKVKESKPEPLPQQDKALEKPPRSPTTSSQPPSLEDVVNYCASKGSNIDPVRFYDYYSSRSWLSGGKPVADWRSLVTRWALTERPGKQRVMSALEYRARPEKNIDLSQLKKQCENI